MRRKEEDHAMPFARISLLKGKSPAFLQALSDNLHRALVDAFEVPADDRFQIIHQHEPGELVFDRQYLCGPRSNNFVLICITAGKPRETSVKQAFYRRLVALLADAPGLRPEDVMVVINTTGLDDWSFGGGIATMLAAAAPEVPQ
jgi:phenylpyruvate tautomerase PptA (4-oxalocrotonate tautomerase family)